ncbi:hypothetical protein BY458DRAFT_537947 [Sporodiniella umbellata]|nr:hypothetical protein BY458DRAFT_537947 [Sporodiniella umbellata]
MAKRKNTKLDTKNPIPTKKEKKLNKKNEANPSDKKEKKTATSIKSSEEPTIRPSKTEEEETLQLEGFDWTGINSRVDSSDEEEVSSDEEEEEMKQKKKKKQEVEDITDQLDNQVPQNAHEFERLLVGSPNSSYLWINYMAYALKLSEIDKARDLGERALKTINFREEQEKMNVWVALLNLENNFGSEDSLQEVFKRAIVYCEPIKVYQQMTEIYERSDKLDKAESVWEEMCKKFSQVPDVWVGYGAFLLQQDKTEKARETLQRCLRILPKYEHTSTVLKFAQLEFKHGEVERGRTLLEGMVSNQPKRLDLWSVYLDMEIKAGDIEMTRRLFERVASLKFSSKKMKFIFKKWLLFEKSHGSEDDVQRVKERTLAYVESMS